MFGRKKEQQVHETIKEHLFVVEETVQSMVKAVEEYVAGNLKEADENAYKTHTLESRADELRRIIIAKLYKGAFLPFIREDLINYVAKQDKLADSAESCCDFLITQKPRVPEAFANDFLNLARMVNESVHPLNSAVENFFGNLEAVKSAIRSVNGKEEEADTVEWHLTEKIFQSEEMSLAEKIHLRELVFHIVHLSDVAEDTADMLDTVIIKRAL